MALPMIPFTKVPPKIWKSRQEKKNRLDLNGPFHFNRPPTPEDEIESNSDSSSEYDLLEHLASLLPGEVVDGKKPPKTANASHLDALQKIKPEPKRSYLSKITGFLGEQRALERERRKHHVIREYEEKIKRYEAEKEHQLQIQLQEITKQENIEELRRLKRIERNSKKKVEKQFLVEQFTSGLQQRERESAQLSFFSNDLVRWQIDGLDNLDAQEIENTRLTKLANEEALRIQRLQEREAMIALDKQQLLEDEQETSQIETMMIRYGMINYSRIPADNVNDMVSNILSLHRKKSMRNMKLNQSFMSQGNNTNKVSNKSVTFAGSSSPSHSPSRNQQQLSINTNNNDNNNEIDEGINTWQTNNNTISNSNTPLSRSNQKDNTIVILSLKTNLDIKSLRNYFFKNQQKRTLGKEYSHPFVNLNFQETGNCKILRTEGPPIQDIGAFALSFEFIRGACPVIEQLLFKDCLMRNHGVIKIFQALKIGNIFTIKHLDFRGNYLNGPEVLNKLLEVSVTGVFTNLTILNLGNNELGDDGIRPLNQLIMNGIVGNIEQIHLQRNNITDIGFQKLIKLLISLQSVKCPQLIRLGLEKNLITGEAKRVFDPIPFYFSL